MTTRDGRQVATIQSPRAIFSPDGSFVGSFAVVTDITEQKKAEAALRVTQFLLDRAPEGAGWTDSEGNLLYMNEVGCKSLEYTQEELRRMKVQDVVPERYAQMFEEYTRTLRSHGTVTYDSVHIAKSGREFPVEVALNCLEFDGKEYFCAFVRDITDRKRSEEALRESEERYRSLFDGVPIGLYRTTPAGRMLDANDALVRVLGYPDRETLLGANVGDIYFDPEDRQRWQRAVEAESSSRIQSFETRIRRYDGPVIWVRFSFRAFRDEEGRIIRYEGALEDVTDRRLAQEALRSSEERFRALVQNASDMISILDPDGTVRYASPSHQRLLGHGPDDFVGGNFLELVHSEDDPLVANALECLVDLPHENLTIEYRCRHRDGTWRTIESTASNLLGHPAVTGIVLNSHDISDRKRAEERLLHDALHDELTGLPNRALFMDRLWQAMERARREPERLMAVLFLDVDQFKIVNDSLGHLVGDELLIQIAHALSSVLRPMDTIARIGGDEFAILLEGGHDVDAAVNVANRIHERLAAPINLGGHEVFITASIGIAVHTPGVREARGPAARRGHGHVPGQGLRPRRPRGLPPRHAPLRLGPPAARERSAARHRARPDRGSLPAVRGPGNRHGDRRRGPDPLEPSAAGPDPPRRLPDRGGGDRAHHPSRPLRAPAGLPAGPRVADQVPRAPPPAGEREPLEQAVLPVRPERADRRGPGGVGDGARIPGAGDHGRGHHPPRRIGDQPLLAAQVPGRAALPGRLRQGLLLAELPPPLPHGHPEDRPFLRLADRRGGRQSLHRGGDREPRTTSSGWRWWPRGSRRLEQVAKLRGLGCEYGQGFFFSHPVDGDEVEGLITRAVHEWPSPVPFSGRSVS